jgi:hypothetical protein
MAKARWESTLVLLRASFEVLRREHPMTIRQLFYRLVSAGVIENCMADYRRVSAVMTDARERAEISWGWIVDRSRPTYSSSTWSSLEDYGEVVASSYRRDYWQNQSRHVVIVVEKDAIVGSIQPIADRYGVTIRTLRGFSSATVAHEIAAEFRELEGAGKQIHALFLGDHDPSGQAIERDVAQRIEGFMAGDMISRCCGHGKGIDGDTARTVATEMRRRRILARVPPDLLKELRQRQEKLAEQAAADLGGEGDDFLSSIFTWAGAQVAEFTIACRHLGLNPDTALKPFVLRRLAIHAEDIRKFGLPPLRVKVQDPRASGFVRQHGDECVELDALPPSELRQRLSRAIRALIDKRAWRQAMTVERAERETTRKVARGFRGLAAGLPRRQRSAEGGSVQ